MTYEDQLGREIILNSPPKRIISVVPSQTELLAYLNLGSEVVGITKFCVHPEKWFRSKKRIGGTKKLHLETIVELEPDLIIANKEENSKSDIEFLSEQFPVWISDVHDLDSAYSMISLIGQMTHKTDDANQLIKDIKREFIKIESALNSKKQRSTAYLIWKDPYMTVGGDTFIDKMMDYAGFKNVFNNKTRYPAIDIVTLRELAPQCILLSTEPYPFKTEHILELKREIPQAEIKLVDGEFFSWYGSRLKDAPSYFMKLNKEFS